MKKARGTREKQIENVIRESVFKGFDCTDVIRNIDFAVKAREKAPTLPGLFHCQYFLWAEAKAEPTGVHEMLAQLILTIGEAGTVGDLNPPAYLGCFDSEKMALAPYHALRPVFGKSDINWKAAPSDHADPAFKNVCRHIRRLDEACPGNLYVYDLRRDAAELARFIKQNFVAKKTDVTRIRIDKNNFVIVYNKWLGAVRPTIGVNWDATKKSGIIDADFFLADLLSDNNQTLKDKLFVVLKSDKYLLNRRLDDMGLDTFNAVDFTDGQRGHHNFWMKYERPPLKEYWDYIVERRDLLVAQDIRERKGSFFTPQAWVELSQCYIADALGEDWQDEYYVWDCAAGTGNLLAGLTNRDNIWASTLDQADVDVMKDRIRNGANLWPSQVFRFDFLNDDFSKLPEGLREIIKDPEKRKRLVVYINPPYAEVSTIGGGKAGVNQSNIHDRYTTQLGTAGREIYTQFLARIYSELSGCVLAEFSKIKILQGSAFEKFRIFFRAKLKMMFVVPANTFDNVNGKFPIGFKIWDTNKNDMFHSIEADVFDENGVSIGIKHFCSYNKKQYINKWISLFKDEPKTKDKQEAMIGFMDGINGNDFGNNNKVFIVNAKKQLPNPRGIWINAKNLIPVSVYLAVRRSIAATWLNDRDQFLCPNDGWRADAEFQNDCLAYTLFSNNIQSQHGPNHWIPFTEKDVGARDKFASRFMSDYLAGKAGGPPEFSAEALVVFAAGRELWRHYHAMPSANLNASLYDIREHFKGRDAKGRMKAKSEDETFNQLDAKLRAALKALAKKIEPKIFLHGFLKG